ncbi:hypothetical protein KC19_12G055100 [Ceratodon purpureus]|uniref:Uncharacterized protein n=1 Tax=Ceratodon purpureus TaxID=3225 RepID=A0A8T0G533_CERPU|nr:hypothetical protein KC19_12G055100 [Ceratodon purpureus]
MEPSSKRRGVVFNIPSVSAEEHERADDINEMSIDEVGLHRYTSRWQEPQFGIKAQDFSQSWWWMKGSCGASMSEFGEM